MKNIARNSVVVTLFNVAGSLLVFLSSVVIAYKFGAGREMDVYFAATSLPFFIMTILSLTLNFTFIPFFATYNAKAGAEKWKIVSSFINSTIILTAILAGAGMVFSERIMEVITPGFSQDKLTEAARLMALLFPAVILSALNELLSGVYYSHNRFLTPSFNKILNPAITVVYVLAFGSVMSTSSLVLAMLSAFFIQAVILVAGFLRHKDFDYSLSLEFNHPEVVNIFKLMAPLIAAMAVTKTAPIIDRFFLSRLGEGSISHVGYAYRFTMRLLETTSTGLILVLFPVLSAHAASLDYAKMRHYLMRGIKMLIFLTMPFVAIFAVHGKPAIRFLFERGRFTAYDTDATFRAFAVYLLSVPMVVAVSVLSRGLYAIQKNRLIAGSSVLVMLFYVAVCSALIGFAGCLAVPLANLASFCASAAIFGLFARRFLGMTDFRAHAVETLKNILAAALAALALSPAMGFAKENLVSYTAACLLGGVVYVALSRYAFRLEASETVLCHMESYVKTFFKRISQKRCYGK